MYPTRRYDAGLDTVQKLLRKVAHHQVSAHLAEKGGNTMRVQEIKKQIKLSEWAEHIKSHNESGLSVREWCAGNGITPSTCYYRIKRVREEFAESIEPKGLLLPASGLDAQGQQRGLPVVKRTVSPIFAEVDLTEMTPICTSPTDSVCIETSSLRITAGNGYPTDKLAEILRLAVLPCC